MQKSCYRDIRYIPAINNMDANTLVAKTLLLPEKSDSTDLLFAILKKITIIITNNGCTADAVATRVIGPKE